MNILITGIAGLLGSRLAEWLIDHNDNINIIGIDDLSGGYKSNIPTKSKFYEFNLLDNKQLEKIFQKHNIDIVYHFAAYAAEGLSPFIRNFNYSNNLLCTTNIINNCINYNVQRLVFTSSMAVFGDGQPPFKETDLLTPIDPYGIAKYASELDIQVANDQHKLDFCIIRPHNIIGRNQNIWDKYRNVIGIWMRQRINEQDLTIFGDGEQKRAFSVVDNCLEPLWLAGISDKAKNQIINLGGIYENTINEMVDMVIDITKGGQKKYLEPRHEVKNAWCDFQKSIDLLDYKENISLYDGLVNMWEWVTKQPNREVKSWASYEITKGIYQYWK